MGPCARGGEPKPTNVKTTFGHDVGLLLIMIGGNLTKHDIDSVWLMHISLTLVSIVITSCPHHAKA
jgi:hypothetical protein